MNDMPKHRQAIHVINRTVTLQMMFVVVMAFVFGWWALCKAEAEIARQDKVNQERVAVWKK